MSTTLKLTEPTVFNDLNKTKNRPPESETTELPLITLKYKHFRDVLKYPERDQMHHLMLMMTGLSENDLGELNADDAAEVSKLIFSAMKKYMDLGKQIVQSMNE